MLAIKHRLSIAVLMSLAMCAFGIVPTIAKAQEGSKPHVVVVGTRAVVATVVAIDYSTRMVTLERTDGKTVTFRVGDNFPNLDRVKQGDTVKAVYLESTAIAVRKPDGSPTASETVEVVRHGHKPEGTFVKTITVVATVTAIDHRRRTATLRGPDGNSTEVRAGPEVKRFNEVKKGDQVVVEITEALAVSVQK